ncbi:MAG TPA: hypothetical protein VFU86_05735, partial [Terriglobales bacterium]|nr:hypothetical protein [Terriglobales bacterium]
MPADAESPRLKAVILAGGRNTVSDDGRPLVLETLGDKSILAHVLDKARRLVEAENLYVVVGNPQAEIGGASGNGYHS